MATKKNFTNPAEGLLGIGEVPKIKEEDNAGGTSLESKIEDANKKANPIPPEIHDVPKIVVTEKQPASEKNLNYQLKYSLSTSSRMNRIVDKLKENDPENASKYSKKYFIDQAIEKALINYEKELGI